jgi:hypothetical protein
VVGKVHSSRNEKASSYSHRGLHDPGQAGVVRQDYPQGMERSLLFFITVIVGGAVINRFALPTSL